MCVCVCVPVCLCVCACVCVCMLVCERKSSVCCSYPHMLLRVESSYFYFTCKQASFVFALM